MQHHFFGCYQILVSDIADSRRQAHEIIACLAVWGTLFITRHDKQAQLYIVHVPIAASGDYKTFIFGLKMCVKKSYFALTR